MPKHRSFKLDKFINAVDNKLLKAYFTEEGVPTPALLDADNVEKLLDKIEIEDKEKRDNIEEQLYCINDIADRSRDCLQSAITEFDIEINDTDSPETVAMKVFLHPDEEAFSIAYDHYLYTLYSEKLSHHQFKESKCDFCEQTISELKKEIEQYFKQCGKSDNCKIRDRTDGDKNIIFVARGDYIKTHSVFEKGEPKIQSFRPAKEDLLVFNNKNSVLSLNINGNEIEKIKYIETFGKNILGLSKIDEDTINKTLVSLEPIKKSSFNYTGNEFIENVKLTEVRVKQAGFIRLIIGAPDITKLFSSYGLSHDKTEFISAKLKFAVRREGKKSKNITVEIKPPETTKLKERKETKIIEDYLRKNGVLLV